MLNELLFDCFYDDDSIVLDFFKEFGAQNNSLLFEYIFQWLLQIPLTCITLTLFLVLAVPNAFFTTVVTRLQALFTSLELPFITEQEEGLSTLSHSCSERIAAEITHSLSPGHSLLLYQFLPSQPRLLYQIRSVTALSMAIKYL